MKEKQKKNWECQYNEKNGKTKIDKHLIRLMRKKRLKLLEIKEGT